MVNFGSPLEGKIEPLLKEVNISPLCGPNDLKFGGVLAHKCTSTHPNFRGN